MTPLTAPMMLDVFCFSPKAIIWLFPLAWIAGVAIENSLSDMCPQKICSLIHCLFCHLFVFFVACVELQIRFLDAHDLASLSALFHLASLCVCLTISFLLPISELRLVVLGRFVCGVAD